MTQRKWKRRCAFVSAAVIAAQVLFTVPGYVLSADGEGTTADGFSYEIKGDAATITGYTGEDKATVTSLRVPDSVLGVTVTKIGRSAFESMPALSSIDLPEGLQRLEDNVFWGDESLKELTLPKGIPLDSIASYSYIGGWGSTFRESYIEKIILEDGAQYVPTNLCYGSGHIRTVVIPDTVTEIGGYAFQCASVTDITLPDSIQKIGQRAFKDSGITEIELPHGLTEIGSSIFENCPGITSLVLPATVTAARYALSNSSIETLTIADGMETVPEYLASGAKSLKTLYLPRSVTAFGYACFEETAITEFTMPKQVTAGESVFKKSALGTVSFEDGVTKIPDKFFKESTALKMINWIPDITEVGEYAFQYSGLETLAIPDTVQKIGYNSFSYCDSLTDLRLPENEMMIGNGSFYGCNALESVCLPKMAPVEERFGGYYEGFGYGIFQYCKNLKKIEFAPDTEQIPSAVCSGCDALTEIIWPAAPRIILSGAFENCIALETVRIPDSVTTIGDHAFDRCSALSDLHLPASLNEIGREVFRSTTSLRELYLPNELTVYGGYYPFRYSGIVNLEIADGITAIGNTTFGQMENLTTVQLPDSLISIGENAFEDCYALTNLVLPPNLETVDANAFNECFSLTEITIPKKLTGKGWGGFAYSGIEELTFEDGMTTIPGDVFRNMTSLRTVHIPASVTEIGKGAFGGCTVLDTVDAPLDTYKFYSTTFDDCDALDDERFVSALKKDSFINVTSSADAENKMTHYTVYYSVNPRFRELMTDMYLEVSTGWRADIIRESLPENISAGQGGFSFHPDQPEGVIRFSIRTADEKDTSVKVTLGVKQNNDWDWAGWYKKNIVSSGVPAPALSLNAPDRAKQTNGTAAFSLSGYAPAGQEVTLSVKNKQTDAVTEQTVTASPYTGRYAANIEIAAENGQILHITAVCGSLKQEADVTCDASQNELIRVMMTHDERTYDITESFTLGTMPFFPCRPGKPLSFEVTLADNACEVVFVSSTVSGKASLIELRFNESTGTWIGEGFFDTTIPGTLNVLAFPKEHAEVAYSHKQSDGTETLEINGHEALEFLKDEPDPYEAFVNATNAELVASDDHGLITAYDCSLPGEEPSGIVSYLGQQDSLMMGGKAVTPQEVAQDPAKYGFDVSPMVVADEDGMYHVYLVKAVTDTAEVQEIAENVSMDAEIDLDLPKPAEARPGAAELTEEQKYQRDYTRNINPLLRLLAYGGEHSDKLSKFANGTIVTEFVVENNPITGTALNLDKTGTAKSFTVTISDAVGKQALSDLIEKKFPKNGKLFNKVTERGMAYAECGTAAMHMIDEQKTIIGSKNEYVNKNETKLLNYSIGLTMMKTSYILASAAAVSGIVATAAGAIAAGAAASTVALPVVAAVGFVWGVGLLVDKAISLFDETITAGSAVGGDGRVRPIIDPSGIAYEWVPSNPLEGVTAEIYYQDESGNAVKWNAEDYEQVNPQITDKSGWFAWDVPEGLWQVRLTAEGYDDTASDWLPVLPVQTDVNLCMRSTLPSELKSAAAENGAVTVTFTKHMLDDSITAESLYLTDASGAKIPCSIEAVKEADNDTAASITFRLTPDGAADLENSTLHLTADAKSYAGTASAAATMPVALRAMPGDLNFDGEHGLVDAVLLARYLAEDGKMNPTIAQKISTSGAADVDTDGAETMLDLRKLLRILAGAELPA